jgi:hypothetical protein
VKALEELVGRELSKEEMLDYLFACPFKIDSEDDTETEEEIIESSFSSTEDDAMGVENERRGRPTPPILPSKISRPKSIKIKKKRTGKPKIKHLEFKSGRSKSSTTFEEESKTIAKDYRHSIGGEVNSQLKRDILKRFAETFDDKRLLKMDSKKGLKRAKSSAFAKITPFKYTKNLQKSKSRKLERNYSDMKMQSSLKPTRKIVLRKRRTEKGLEDINLRKLKTDDKSLRNVRSGTSSGASPHLKLNKTSKSPQTSQSFFPEHSPSAFNDSAEKDKDKDKDSTRKPQTKLTAAKRKKLKKSDPISRSSSKKRNPKTAKNDKTAEKTELGRKLLIPIEEKDTSNERISNQISGENSGEEKCGKRNKDRILSGRESVKEILSSLDHIKAKRNQKLLSHTLTPVVVSPKQSQNTSPNLLKIGLVPFYSRLFFFSLKLEMMDKPTSSNWILIELNLTVSLKDRRG